MKKIVSLLLVLAMLLLMLPLFGTVTAEAATKKETKRIVGIVFDNSGSMYDNGFEPPTNYRWCQATYAMEVFASMLNSSDELRIYPMWEIQVGGKTYSMNDPLVIKGPSEAQRIREIYTVWPSGTPGTTIDCAYNDLVAAKGFDEKHLIVLTDGAMNEMTDASGYVTEEGILWLRNKLDSCSDKMDQVMYLAIGGSAIPLTENRSNQYYCHAEVSKNVLTELTAMCNRIFGRNQLVYDGSSLTFDVSMSKIIVFAQGANVTDVEITGMNHTSKVNTKYSERGTHSGRDNNVDTSLQGIIATYEGELDAGTYNISFAGEPDAICVYYEPDVDIRVRLMGPDGEIGPNEDLYEGNYTVEFCIVDRDGNPVDSDLLGDVDFAVTITKNGVEETHRVSGKSGSVPISLAGGDTFDAEFVATYLNGYEVRKKGSDFGWPSFGFNIKYPEKPFVLQLSGGADTIGLTKLEKEAVFQLKMYYDGVQLTGDALDAVVEPIHVQLSGGNAEYTMERTEDGYEIRVQYHGDAKNTQVGEYTLTIGASCKNEDGEIVEAAPLTKKFVVEDNAGQFTAEVVMEQDYYVIADIDQGKPIYINLACGGAPLTAEQFAATKVTVDLGGLPYDLIPDEANSRYQIVLKEGEGLVKGKYMVSVKVDGQDEIGRSVTFEDSRKLQVQPYSRAYRVFSWLVIILLIIIAIVVIVLLITNAKVFPKDIRRATSTFTVDGETVPGAASVVLDPKGRIRRLKITSPNFAANPQARCTLNLEVEAYSPRKTRSASRHVRIRSVNAPHTTSNVQIGGLIMRKENPDIPASPLVRVGGNPKAPLNFHFGNRTNVVIQANIPDPNDANNTIPCTLTVSLQFY